MAYNIFAYKFPSSDAVYEESCSLMLCTGKDDTSTLSKNKVHQCIM